MREVLATIELDGVPGRGELYWQDGDIWCHELTTGKRFATQTGCPVESDAVETISLAWGAKDWDIEEV